MFCSYETLRELSVGKFSTIWLAGEKPKLVLRRTPFDNADVMSACDSLVKIARMRSPPLEVVGPGFRLPVPRPKLAFTWMANFLKGITIIHRHQTVVLYDLCSVLVKQIFSGMLEPADTGVSIIEIEDDYDDPPKKRRRTREIKPSEGAPEIDLLAVPNLQDLNMTNIRDSRDITMVEHCTPPPQPETFADMPVTQPDEPVLSPGNLRAVADARARILRQSADASNSHQPQVSFEHGVSQPQNESRTPAVLERESGPDSVEMPHRAEEVRPAEPVLPAEQVLSAEQVRPAEEGESINTSSITLLSAQKRKRDAVARRRRVPMKTFVKSLSKMQEYSKSPSYLRKLQASESWKDQMATEPFKSVAQLLNTPHLKNTNPLYMNLFCMERSLHSNLNGQVRSKAGTPPNTSPETSRFRDSKSAAPNGGQQPSDLSMSYGNVTGIQPLACTGVSGAGRTSVAADPTLHQEAVVQADNFENPAQEQVVESRELQVDEVPAKRQRLDEPQTSIVSPGRLWDRTLLKDEISQQWSRKGNPITFYDLCPRNTSSVKTASRILAALLDLHLKKEVVLGQQNNMKLTPILIYMPGTQL